MNKQVDLFIFAGQSNMAGRGESNKAPKVVTNRAWEFRAVSDPTKLYPIQEPFGLLENEPEGIYEPDMKKGSMVSSFINSFSEGAAHDIVTLSASKGGSSIVEWQPGTAYYKDLISRVQRTKAWLKDNGFRLENTYCLWLQGETDGDLQRTEAEYQQLTTLFFQQLISDGVDEIFILEIGNQRDEPDKYSQIKSAQKNLGSLDQVTFIPTTLSEMAASGHMVDQFHYDQFAYDRLGLEVSAAVAEFLNKKTDKLD